MLEPVRGESWTPAWVRDAIFYQIFPDRFARSDRVAKPGPLESWDSPPTVHGFKGGDLLGVVEHLDHIQAIGANAIYFTPIFQSASNHRYHTFDYRSVDPLLGGDAALRELIDACHDRGIRVVLDGVFNHASRGFWPFHHVMETGKSSPYRDWFFFDEAALEAGRQLRAYPEESTTQDIATIEETHREGLASKARFGYQAWWGLPALPKLNTDHPDVRAYLLDVAEAWLRFGIDGWRLDVANEVPADFWRVFRQRVKAVKPDAYIVAEIWHEAPDDLRGDMYDAQMHYELGAAITSFVGVGRHDRRVVDQHPTVAAAVREDDAAQFAARLERAFSINDPACTYVQLNLLGSHDTPRFLSMVGGDTDSLRLATLIQMTVPGAPSIYYGDEIGMLGELDPGSRAAFPWDRPDTWDRALQAYVGGAAATRRANPVLRQGSFQILAAQDQVIAYLRRFEGRHALITVNAGDVGRRLAITLPDMDGHEFRPERWAGMTGPTMGPVTVESGRVELDLAPRDGAVWLAD